MRKLFFIIVMLLAVMSSSSAQVMPHMRVPTPEEAKIIKITNTWHTVAVSSSITAAGFAAMAGIYQIERTEAEFASKYNTDKVIVYTACLLAGTSAFVATISWGEYAKFKHRMPKNKLVLKTSPSGLIVEF